LRTERSDPEEGAERQAYGELSPLLKAQNQEVLISLNYRPDTGFPVEENDLQTGEGTREVLKDRIRSKERIVLIISHLQTDRRLGRQ